MMFVQPNAPFTRNQLTQHLEDRKIATRMLFGGNLVRQPALTQLAEDARREGRPLPYRVVGDLSGADRLMNGALFLGTYPGIDEARVDYMCEVLTEYLQQQTGTVA
jgi:CDP-6-deoxy-D-xylo-4-hexulose-3-dehydrase